MKTKRYMQFIEAYYIDDKLKNSIATDKEISDFVKTMEKNRERENYIFTRNKYDPNEFVDDVEERNYQLKDSSLDKYIDNTEISDDVKENGTELDRWIGKFLNLLYNNKEKRLYTAHLLRSPNDSDLHVAYNILHNIEEWLDTPTGERHSNAVVSGLPHSVSQSIAMALSDKYNLMYRRRNEFRNLRNLYMLNNESVLLRVHDSNSMLDYFGITKSPYLY